MEDLSLQPLDEVVARVLVPPQLRLRSARRVVHDFLLPATPRLICWTIAPCADRCYRKENVVA